MIVLTTDRLELRRFDTGDAEFILALLNDAAWIRHIGDRNLHSVDDARAWIETRLIDVYDRLGFGFWAVQLRGDAQPIGLCGLIKRDTLPEVDVGYAFMPAHRGHGYAREATLGCLKYAHETLGFQRILAITSPENTASQRVLESAGMRLEERRAVEGWQGETWVYAWQAPVDPNRSR